MNKIVFFDGDCPFCNKTVMYLANIDRKHLFLFVSNLSATGEGILKTNRLYETSKETIIVSLNGQFYTKSTAVYQFFKATGRLSMLRWVFRVIPKFLLDWGYGIISKHRLSISNTSCAIPKPEQVKKIILE